MQVPANDRGIVLVVDDEPLIRLAAADMILEAGYESLEAKDADEAMRILRERSDIGFLFTDINMPGSMNGLELAHAAHNAWPPIRIVVTSGRGIPQSSHMPDGGRFLSKPYLSASVTQALFGRAA